MEKNDVITFDISDVKNILEEIELILISLHNMGAYYYEHGFIGYEKETAKFIDDNEVTARLAYIRMVLSKSFDTQLPDDYVRRFDDYLEMLQYWEKPGDKLTRFEKI